MKHPPTIKSARIIGPLALEIEWSTGETFTADLSGSAMPLFNVLRDPDLFAKMTIDEWGHGLDWPGGLDLGADMLYGLCRKQHGLPTPAEFDDWMRRNHNSTHG